jgi:alcohol dehydrogenase (cytochrome c)
MRARFPESIAGIAFRFLELKGGSMFTFSRTLFVSLLAVLSFVTACEQPASNNAANTASAVSPTPAAPAQAVADGDWPGYNRTLDSLRYSPLSQITPANVSNLKEVCSADLGEGGNYQSGIVMANNTLFATTETGTYAYDPATCQLKWKHTIEKPAKEGLRVNRGVAYADGKIFRGLNTGEIAAINAADGKELWRTKFADPDKGESVPAAPVAWNGMVFIGQAGGDNKGVRGRMHAFNAADGKEVWKFDLVPLEGPGSDTWPTNDPANPRTGGATWTSYTIDPATGLLYVPAGNAAPDFDIRARPGLNLYTNSIVILDAKTGAFKDYYQLTPNDFHDWDVAAAPALIKTTGGKNLIVAGGKDGILHAVDPAQKREIYKTPVTTIENAETPFSEKDVHFCPGVQGGVEWNGPSFHPQQNLVFVNSIDWCYSINLMQKSPPPGPLGAPYTGEADADEPFGRVDPKEKWKGWVTAVNADDGTVKWKYQSPTPMIAAITATGGGLVFTGDLDGNMLAFNGADGSVLWKHNLGTPIGGGVITYLANNKQHVAVAAGITSMSWQTKAGNAKVFVYSLP